jgi:hypothetical protein
VTLDRQTNVWPIQSNHRLERQTVTGKCSGMGNPKDRRCSPSTPNAGFAPDLPLFCNNAKREPPLRATFSSPSQLGRAPEPIVRLAVATPKADQAPANLSMPSRSSHREFRTLASAGKTTAAVVLVVLINWTTNGMNRGMMVTGFVSCA